MALSPDGRKVAFVAHGEVFAASARDGGDRDARQQLARARAPGHVGARQSSRRVRLRSRWHAGALHLRLRARDRRRVSPRRPPATSRRSSRPTDDRSCFSAGVASCASWTSTRSATDCSRARSSVASRSRRTASVAWSPDGRWIAYIDQAGKNFSNVYLVPSAGGESRQVTFLANVFGGTISWAPDGTYLIYDSSQRTEDRQLARIDLVLRTPRFREDQFRDLFRVETRNPAQPTPIAPAASTPRPTAPTPSDSAERPAATDSAAAKPNAATRRPPGAVRVR